MVTDDQSNLCFELARLMPEQQILQAVRESRDENRNSCNLIAEDQVKLHATLKGNSLKALGDAFPRNLKPVQFPLSPGQEDARLNVSVLVEMEKVSPVAKHKVGDPGNQATTIRARHQ
jgi:hypothetical protein